MIQNDSSELLLRIQIVTKQGAFGGIQINKRINDSGTMMIMLSPVSGSSHDFDNDVAEGAQHPKGNQTPANPAIHLPMIQGDDDQEAHEGHE